MNIHNKNIFRLTLNRFAAAGLGAIVLGAATLFTTGLANAKVGAIAATSPWAISYSSTSMGAFRQYNALLSRAGVKWVRIFPEWAGVEPKRGEYHWSFADALVKNAKKDHLQITGFFGYLAPWASANGDTRTFPLRHWSYWREHVRSEVARYKNYIHYWEIYNEFNGSFANARHKAKTYAKLMVEAYNTARSVDPHAKIIMSCANFDVGFFDRVIKDGGAGHFNVIAVHPYELLAGVMQRGQEANFLSMTASLRHMLAKNHQPTNIPLWINEVGYGEPMTAKGNAIEAQAVVKLYVLSLAEGFQRIFWYQPGGNSGLVIGHFQPRPSYFAYKNLTSLLGQDPRYVGWLNPNKKGYGFVFQGAAGPVLAAWLPAGETGQIRFHAPVQVVSVTGTTTTLPANTPLDLTNVPVLVSDVPAATVALAQSHHHKPFPWGGDYTKAKTVYCQLGAVNINHGLSQVKPGTTAVVNGLTATWRRPRFNDAALHGEGRYIYFSLAPTFAASGAKDVKITITARRMHNRPAGMGLMYESVKGYRGAPGYWSIPAGKKWHSHSWTIHDGDFSQAWGFAFRADASGSPNEFYVKEARVTKLQAHQ